MILTAAVRHILTHFDVRDDALMLKKVALDWLAMHLPESNNIYLT